MLRCGVCRTWVVGQTWVVYQTWVVCQTRVAWAAEETDRRCRGAHPPTWVSYSPQGRTRRATPQHGSYKEADQHFGLRRKMRGTTVSLCTYEQKDTSGIFSIYRDPHDSWGGERTTCYELDPGLLGYTHTQLESRDREAHRKPSRYVTIAVAGLLHRDGVDWIGASEQHPVCPRARRERLIALSKAHKQCVIRHSDARKASVRNACSVDWERSV